MKKFSNLEYSQLISNLIDEANYMDISNRSKMARLRDIAEILVRKMLNIGNDTQVMLGKFKTNCSNEKVVLWLSNIDRNLQKSFIDIVEGINKLTRNAHHTQETHDYTETDVSLVEEYILDLYSMLFIQFFIDIKIDIYTEPEILTRFSLLPPIIRYKTWNYLYNDNINNIQVVDKLCLSIIKVYGKQETIDWLNVNKDKIMSIPYPAAEEILKYKIIHRDKNNPNICNISLDFESYDNLYDLLLTKINYPNTSINEKGRMYKSFEEAKIHFEKFNTISDDSSENLKKLHDIMEFVYIGRKTAGNNI